MPKKPSVRTTSRGLQRRQVNTRRQVPRFLIICEGERTEPNYFKGFHIPTRPAVKEIDIRGIGYNTIALVKEAIKLRRENGYERKRDQVWCVLDRDSFPLEHFNQALDLARRERICVAYSNEAFEIWYLLHFHFHNAAISRHDYEEKLTRLLGYKYEKNSVGMYAALENRQLEAIRNAERLLEQYAPRNPAKDNPSTTVYELVKELRRFVR